MTRNHWSGWLCLATLHVGLTSISSAQSVTLTSFPITTPGSDLRNITAGPDGALWFTETASNKIGRITAAGVVTEYAVPTPMPTGCGSCGPYGIAAGSDGAVWFTEIGANNIGRITSVGIISEYPIPTPNSGPWGIALGPDGAMWFTESENYRTGAKIGRITTAGTIAEYPLPSPNSYPRSITAAPDGAMWFTESIRIGRITLSGTIAEYDLGGGSAYITLGADGALWFLGGNGIGRITTAGAITSYSLNLPAPAGVCGLTSGPDGALWFTACGSDPVTRVVYSGIGRITMAGSAGIIERFFTDNNGVPVGPYGITLGPDGALWFVSYASIGRVALQFPTPSITAVRNGSDGYLQTIQSNSWVTIYGFDLAGSERVWGAQDIVNGELPLRLDGVSVTIDGEPAPVEYISSSQINVLAPDDTAVGPVNVTVTDVNAVSAPFSVQLQTYSPAFFTFPPPNQKYAAAILAPEPDGTFSYLAPIGALGTGVQSRPARAGDIVELYATGFGPTIPSPPVGQVFSGAYPTVATVTAMIGGADAVVAWAGLISPGLFQLNVTVPSGLPTGDASIVATVGGVQTQSGVFIPVQE